MTWRIATNINFQNIYSQVNCGSWMNKSTLSIAAADILSQMETDILGQATRSSHCQLNKRVACSRALQKRVLIIGKKGVVSRE